MTMYCASDYAAINVEEYYQYGGKVTIDNTSNFGIGIKTRSRFDLNLNKGELSVTSAGQYAINADTGLAAISIANAKVTAKATGNNSCAIKSKYNLSITNSEVTAEATGTGSCAIYSSDAGVTITDSKVTATGAEDGSGIKTYTGNNAGFVALSLSGADNYVQASNYVANTVYASAGKYLIDEDGNLYGGAATTTLTADQVSAVAGKTLVPAYGVGIDSMSHGTVTSSPKGFRKDTFANANKTVTLSITPDLSYTLSTLTVTGDTSHASITPDKISDNEYTFIMPAESPENVTVSATFTQPAVKYLDASGTEQSCSSYTALGGGHATTLDGGWYVVPKNTTAFYDGTITLDGTVNLILADGAVMNVGTETDRISGSGISGNGKNLTVYGQSNGENAGILKVYNNTINDANDYGIYMQNGSFIQNSGKVVAGHMINGSSENCGGGIYCENFTVNGGSLDAQSKGSNAVSVRDDITINGGSVTIRSTNTHALLATTGGITINGGSVNAVSESINAAINGLSVSINGGSVSATNKNTDTNYPNAVMATGGDIILGGSGADDSINAAGYQVVTNYSVKVADGKCLTDGTNAYYGTLTGDQISAIAKANKTTLVPAYGVMIGTVTNGTVSASPAAFAIKDYANANQTVRLTVTPASNYTIGTVSYNDGSDHKITKDNNDKYPFTMPGRNVTASATFLKSLSHDDINVADIADQTYTGSAITPSVTVTDGETPLTLGTDYTVSYSNNINVSSLDAGTASPTVTIKGTGSYGGETTKTFKITPKSITGATVALSNTQLEYNGSAQSVSVTGVTLDGKALTTDDYEVTGDTSGTAKGTYTVTVTGKGNYKDTQTATWAITDKLMTVTAPDVTATYDGQAHGITVNVKDPSSGATIQYGDSADSCAEDASPTITNVSDSPKTVYFKITADNYQEYKGSATVTISPKSVTVSGIKAVDKDYDGTKTATLNFDDIKFNGETIAGLSVTATGEFENADAGLNKTVNISIQDLQGTNAQNYTLPTNGRKTTAKATIKTVNIPTDNITAPAAITGLVFYESSAKDLVTRGSVAGDIGTMWYAATDSTVTTAPTFDGDSSVQNKQWSRNVPARRDAGTYKVWYLVKGDKNHNENAGNTDPAAPISVTIAQAVAPSFENITMDRAYTETGVSVSLAGKMPSDAGMLTYTTANKASVQKASGSNIVLRNFSVSDDGVVSVSIENGAVDDIITLPVKIQSTNYADTTVSVIITLVAKTEAGVTIREGDKLTKTYGSGGFTLHASIADRGTGIGALRFTSDKPSVAAVTDDGQVTIVSTGKATLTAKYESDTTIGEASLELTIDPKAVTITGVTAKDKEYDGTTNAEIDDPGTVSGAVSGDDVKAVRGKAEFDSKDLGTGKTVTFSGFTLGGAKAGCYVLTAQPSAGKAAIRQKTLTVSFSASGRTYEKGNTKVSVSGGSLSGVVGGDDVTLDTSGLTGNLTDPNAGNNKTVSISGYSLKGSDIGNYSLSVTPVTVNIAKASYKGSTTASLERYYLYSKEASDSISLAPYLPDDYGSVETGNATKSGSVQFKAGPAVSGAALSYTLSPAEGSKSGEIKASVQTQNYTNTFTVTVAVKQEALALYEKTGKNYERCSAKALTAGQSFTLVPLFADGEVLNERVVWESSNPEAASVTQNGTVTTRSAGEASITARSEEDPKLAASCTVTVTEPVAEILLDKASYEMGAGESFTLHATVLPFTASQTLKWSADSANVTLLPSEDTLSAKVTGKAAGKAVVTAEATDGSGKKATCSFTIGNPVPNFTIAGRNGEKNLKAGKTLEMAVTWSGAKPKNAGLTWSVSLPGDDGNKNNNVYEIATISEKGVLKGISEGTVRVTAVSTANPNRSAYIDIPVYVPVSSVSLNTEKGTVSKADEANGLQLSVNIVPAVSGLEATGVTIGSAPTVVWSVDSKYKESLTLDSKTGLVTAKDKAAKDIPVKATVTAYNGYQKTLTCKVTVKEYNPLKGISLSKNRLTIGLGNTDKLTASLNPLNPDGEDGMEWKSFNESVVAVDQDGNLVGKSVGTAIVTVTAKGTVTKKGKERHPSASCKVTVKPSLTAIEFTNEEKLLSQGLGTGSGFKLKTKLTFSDGSTASSGPVSYKSSDPSLATVTAKGEIRAKKAGTVTITAVSTEKKADAKTLPEKSVTFDVFTTVQKLKLDHSTLTLGMKEGMRTGRISIIVLPEGAEAPAIEWKAANANVSLAAGAMTEDPEKASYASPGQGVTTAPGQVLFVKAEKPGTVKLAGVTKNNAKKMLTCNVTVRGEVTALSLKEKNGSKGYNDVTWNAKEKRYKSTMKSGGAQTIKTILAISGVTSASDKKTYDKYKKVTDTGVSFRSSDTSVATVDKNGKVKVKKKIKAGTTVTICVASADGKQTAELLITVQ
ncbi:MAG: Ig-like domain-containing protein [Lachnospiraceae bacterium]|nr:Ig-like domain-containing protein [Lachnospiraceae bacterium]